MSARLSNAMRSMPSERVLKALLDIQDNILLAEAWSAARSIEDLANDRMRLYAITRCLEIISEASRRLSPEVRQRHPHIAWRDMRDAGNIYRHDYDGLQERIVLETVRSSLPQLKAVVAAEIEL